MTARAWLVLAGVVVAAIAVWPAGAHNAGISTSRIVIRGRTVDAEINALGRDYEKATGVRITETASGAVNAVALAVMAPSLLAYVGNHVAVLAGDRRCQAAPGSARAADTHVLATITWTCPSDGGSLRYRVTLFQDVDPASRHLAMVATESGEREIALDRAAPELDLSAGGSSLLQVVGRFTRAGIEHIFLGYDHIAFLLAVTLWGRSLWPLIKVVTAFTLVHSLTLCLAVLDIVRLPPSVVEPLIAATIIFVAAENFFIHDISKRVAGHLRARPRSRLRVCRGAARIWLARRRAGAGAGSVQHRRRDRAGDDRGRHLSGSAVVRPDRQRGGRQETPSGAGVRMFRRDPGARALLAG